MRIVFNAGNLLIGGGRRIAKGIIGSLYNLPLEDEIHVFLPRKNYYTFKSTENIKIHYLPAFVTRYFPGFLVSLYIFFRLTRIKPDAIFSLGNYSIPTKLNQLLLLQWPYAVYPDSIIWDRMSWSDFLKRRFRLFLFKRNLKYVSAVTVQTTLMQERLQRFIHYKGPIEVIESAACHFKYKENDFGTKIFKLKKSKEDKWLLFMSEYYTHKNLEVIIPLAMKIKERKLPYRIFLTLDKSNHDVANLLENIKINELGDIIINLGRVEQEQAFYVYKNCDALLFPTLLESYGFPFLEAAYCKLPIFTSDLDFAHHMNGENAWYFNPLSSESIMGTIQNAFAQPEVMQKKVDQALEKVKEVPSWEEITQKYIDVIKKM